jgi:glycerophosphoryl diester phosphodiesterase
MVAFEAAIKLGYQYLETDVHVTSDGVLVAFHDDDLSPVSDRQGLIAELPYSKVCQARVQGEPIPLLVDVLNTWPNARINLDAKHDACISGLVEAVRKANAYDRVCLGSFYDKRTNRLRRMTDGRVCTWMGRRQIFRLRLSTAHDRIPGRFMPCAQVPVHKGRLPVVDQRFVDGAHARGVVVQVWTINDRAEMETLLNLGVDGLFSDEITVLKDVLTARGQWTDATT